MDELVLEIRDLHVWYRTYAGYAKVVDGINLNVGAKETVGVVGEAGCGKTTVMRAVLRVLPEKAAYLPSGEVLFQGSDVLAMSERSLRHVRRHGIAMVWQDPSSALNPVFTVGHQLDDIMRYANGQRGRRRERERRSRDTLLEVMIPDGERILGGYPHQLSGGMKQRVCIAEAIVSPRSLLIADEPGTSLDVTIQDQVHRLLRALVAEKGVSLIMITHSLGVAREMTDRIYVMYAGTIVETGRTARLFANAAHPYTVGLLAAVPRLTGGGVAEGIYGYIPDYVRPPAGCRFHPRCPKVMSRCREEKPLLKAVGRDHFAACFWCEESGVTHE